MSETEDLLAPASVAALVAPVMDRIRVRLSRQVPAEVGDIVEAYGLDPVRGAVVGMLRNLLPDRTTARDNVRAAFRYWPDGQADRAVDGLVDGGLLDEAGDRLGLTDTGRALIGEFRGRLAGLLDGLWADHLGAVEAIDELVERALAAAVPTGGPSFALVWPVFEPPGTSSANLLAERITPLRFHRADAHAAAWAAAGLTATEVQALGPGPQREAIEADTNERAAAPYAVLSPAERLALIAGLGRLPA